MPFADRLLLLIAVLGFSPGAMVLADGEKDNIPAVVRPIPPVGIELTEQQKAALSVPVEQLRAAIDAAAAAQAKRPDLLALLPDVEVFLKAVDWAVEFQQVYKPNEVNAAERLLAEGIKRAEALTRGETPWLREKGLVVRGYRSSIDDSVQPYGLVIPQSYVGAPVRLDAWFHGRGETLSELAFIEQRMRDAGQAKPMDTIVLHPYGRYSCANKFAGEIDFLEALAHAKLHYAIDPNRVVVRGFSMGGAACWQFAVHYADRWCAASPGAGFSETPDFLKVFQGEDVSQAPEYQQKMWRWYNATDSALNLFHCPTVAYSGELDRQKQAADRMEEALRSEQIDLVHLIGPQTEHKIHPESMVEIERRLASIAAAGRAEMPYEVHFATWMLRYHRMHWVAVDELKEHWQRTRVHARITGASAVNLRTQNVVALTLDMPSGHCPLSPMQNPVVMIDEQEVMVTRPKSDRSWKVHLRRSGDGRWSETLRAIEPGPTGLVKKPMLQGPIDDAFMDRFLMVTPSKPSEHPKVEAWVGAESARAQREWQRQFRGVALAKSDAEVTDEDIASCHLVLWGDSGSNAVVARILDRLPIRWSGQELEVNGKTYSATDHLPVLIFPNPLNPERYVVLNSGFTYREYAYLNNARQIPMLPDWAVIDLETPPDFVKPGRIADAGFFDEHWQWNP